MYIIITSPPVLMTTSSNENIFRATGPLCGEFTGHRGIPRTKASDVELWCFLWSAPWINCNVNKREAGELRSHRAYYEVINVTPKHSETVHAITADSPVPCTATSKVSGNDRDYKYMNTYRALKNIGQIYRCQTTRKREKVWMSRHMIVMKSWVIGDRLLVQQFIYADINENNKTRHFWLCAGSSMVPLTKGR